MPGARWVVTGRDASEHGRAFFLSRSATILQEASSRLPQGRFFLVALSPDSEQFSRDLRALWRSVTRFSQFVCDMRVISNSSAAETDNGWVGEGLTVWREHVRRRGRGEGSRMGCRSVPGWHEDAKVVGASRGAAMAGRMAYLQ